MTIAYICILIAAIMPYIFVGIVKFGTKGYDNSKPREFLDHLQGMPKRANSAHLNSFEAFPAFAAAVIIAHLSSVSEGAISIMAVSFIIFRILYGICYISNQASLRSLMWFGGFFCVIGLFALSIKHS